MEKIAKKSLSLIILFLFIALVSESWSVEKSKSKFNNSSVKSFNEALTIAKKEKKKIVINIYADWCIWCKKMDKDVFPDVNVQKELNKNFVFFRMNGESNALIEYDGRKFTHAQFVKAFGIRGFPATLFLNYDSKPITVLPGYVDASMFVNVLKYIAEEAYLRVNFDEFLKQKK